jgi:cell division protein FtsI/penicillin-binding protein 2
MGPKRVYGYMRRFGFGRRVGIELPREEIGILWDYRKWNKATMSRAPIGQGISVTPIQMASAYQTIANDGIRKKPYIVDKIVDAEKNDLLSHQEDPGESVIKASTAHTVREMMLDVTTPKGTARRAKVKGYSVAGKTGTAQKTKEGVKGYLPGLYVATFCGIVPSGVVKRYPDDPIPVPPKIVVLVSLDFDEKRRYHAGGNSAGPVFKRITEKAMRYLEVVPDRLDELEEEDY